MANILKPKSRSTNAAAPGVADLADGEMAVNSVAKRIYLRVGGAIVTIASHFSGAWSDLSGRPTTLAGFGITDAQSLNATLSALAALSPNGGQVPLFGDEGATTALSWSTDTTLAADSDTTISSQRAIKAYIDARAAASDAMVFRGVIDCAANPSYPAGERGDTYRVSVAGRIGGASGPVVEAGDILICITDGTASGAHAAVGARWSVIQTNIDGALTTASIGATVQAYSAVLSSFAGLTTAADKGVYATAPNAFATYDLSAGGRALASAAGTANTFPYFSADSVLAAQAITAAGRALLEGADAAAQRATLGLGSAATSAASAFAAASHTHTYAEITGTVPTWNQSTTGSAATLTTARTLTIGSTGKTFNGSANVAWTLTEIGAAAASHVHAIANVTGLQTALNAKLDATATAAAATKLATARTINGVAFDGTANITIAAGASDWNSLSGKPTTVAGFGITDAVTTGGAQTISGAKTHSAPITVQKSSGAQFVAKTTGATPKEFWIGNSWTTADDGVAFLHNRANADMVFGTNDLERGRVLASGVLSWGAGDGSVSGIFEAAIKSNGGSAAFTFADQEGDGPWSLYAAGGVARLNNGADRFKLDAAGNISGIRDLTVSRGDGTGVVYLNSAQTRYVHYDGANYAMPGASLLVGNSVVASGDVEAGTGKALRITGEASKIISNNGLQVTGAIRFAGESVKLAANGGLWIRDPRIFVGGSDPNAAGYASDGDVWIY